MVMARSSNVAIILEGPTRATEYFPVSVSGQRMKLEGRELEEVVDRVRCFEDLHALDILARDLFAPEPHTPLVPLESLAQCLRPELDLHVNPSRSSIGIHPRGEYHIRALEGTRRKSAERIPG
jgi:hypothetical protein